MYWCYPDILSVLPKCHGRVLDVYGFIRRYSWNRLQTFCAHKYLLLHNVALSLLTDTCTLPGPALSRNNGTGLQSSITWIWITSFTNAKDLHLHFLVVQNQWTLLIKISQLLGNNKNSNQSHFETGNDLTPGVTLTSTGNAIGESSKLEFVLIRINAVWLFIERPKKLNLIMGLLSYGLISYTTVQLEMNMSVH